MGLLHKQEKKGTMIMTQHLTSNETSVASGADLADVLAIRAYSELFLDDGAGAQQSSNAEQGDWWRRKRPFYSDWGGRGKRGWW